MVTILPKTLLMEHRPMELISPKTKHSQDGMVFRKSILKNQNAS